MKCKYIINGLELPYWYRKRLSIDLYWSGNELILCVTYLFRPNIDEYKKEWVYSNWDFHVLYTKNK